MGFVLGPVLGLVAGGGKQNVTDMNSMLKHTLDWCARGPKQRVLRTHTSPKPPAPLRVLARSICPVVVASESASSINVDL